jgi:uncharacterized membrane protein
MKFAVGIMLTAFGVFWAAEGAGVEWPGADAALLVLVPAIALLGLGGAALLRRVHAARQPAPAAAPVPPAAAPAKGSTP